MNKKRILELKKIMNEKHLDAIILTTHRESDYNANISYFTGFEGAGILLMKKEPVLLVSSIEYEKAKRTGTKAIVLKKESKEKILKKEIGQAKKIGIDASVMSVLQLEEIRKISGKKTNFVDIRTHLLGSRSQKDKEEIKNIKKACEICDEIFSKIIKNFKFKTEEELSAFIEMEIRKQGLKTSFHPIVSSGKNALDIHHIPGGKITQGFLILDFGCKYKGYCSDMTRTLFIGKPSYEEKKIYEDLLNIQRTAIALAVPGKKCSEIDSFAREMLGERFVHSLGHGVGLEIHEAPFLSKDSKDILRENNVITIEPGVYTKKYGIRIEDTILVTKKQPVILTTSSKELIVIK